MSLRSNRRDEYLKMLRDLAADSDDPEANHLAADRILLNLIDDKEITEAFERIMRWYA